MASNRHLGRIIALQTLFEQDFRLQAGDKAFDLDAVLRRNVQRYAATVDDTQFIERLVHGITKYAAELDITLQPIAPEWPIDQIARMDRMILRMGLYELQYGTDVPPKVVINEAVELAKAFGSENSSRFVNGVLGTALRQIRGDDADEKGDTGDATATGGKAAEAAITATATNDAGKGGEGHTAATKADAADNTTSDDTATIPTTPASEPTDKKEG